MDISVFLFTHFDENCCSKYGMPKHDDLIERSGDLSASAEPETKKAGPGQLNYTKLKVAIKISYLKGVGITND